MIYDIKLTENQIKLIINAMYIVANEFEDEGDKLELYNYLREITGIDAY